MLVKKIVDWNIKNVVGGRLNLYSVGLNDKEHKFKTEGYGLDPVNSREMLKVFEE